MAQEHADQTLGNTHPDEGHVDRVKGDALTT